MDHPASTGKQRARAQAVLIRDAAFAAPDRAARIVAANAHLEQFLDDRFGKSRASPVLAGYIAIRSEADPLPVMARHPGPVCVPVVTGAGQALRFHRWHEGAEMRTGPFGVPVPACVDPLVPQVVIVPGLSFDQTGYRLGYGGGFFDRTLADLRSRGRVLAVGFAFSAQRVDAVPRDATDAALDVLVTDDGTQVFAS